MSNAEKKSGGAPANVREMVEAEITRLFKIATKGDILNGERESANKELEAVDSVLSFNEWIREKGNPDNALEDMEYLDELAECGGDWAKPSYMLARAFYGYRFNPYDPNGEHHEAFNPNDDYFTFNGYGNLVSVREWDWAAYWAINLNVSEYLDYVEETGNLEEIADALGVEIAEDAEEAE